MFLFEDILLRVYIIGLITMNPWPAALSVLSEGSFLIPACSPQGTAGPSCAEVGPVSSEVPPPAHWFTT